MAGCLFYANGSPRRRRLLEAGAIISGYVEENIKMRPQISLPDQELSSFCQRYHVRRLALFGSVLRDDFRPDSDVDVLVSFEQGAHIGFLTLSRMQRELSVMFRRRVDLVPMDGLKLVIRDSVLDSAKEVYAA